jgi:hypothetical protein
LTAKKGIGCGVSNRIRLLGQRDLGSHSAIDNLVERQTLFFKTEGTIGELGCPGVRINELTVPSDRRYNIDNWR